MNFVDLQALQKKFNVTEEELRNTVEELTKTKHELKDTNMVLEDRKVSLINCTKKPIQPLKPERTRFRMSRIYI